MTGRRYIKSIFSKYFLRINCLIIIAILFIVIASEDFQKDYIPRLVLFCITFFVIAIVLNVLLHNLEIIRKNNNRKLRFYLLYLPFIPLVIIGVFFYYNSLRNHNTTLLIYLASIGVTGLVINIFTFVLSLRIGIFQMIDEQGNDKDQGRIKEQGNASVSDTKKS